MSPRLAYIAAACLLCVGTPSASAQVDVPAAPVFTIEGDIKPPYELWLVDADGSNPRKLCDTTGYTCGSPDWSPDGRFIAYDTWKVGQTFSDSQIAIVPADGSQPPRIIGHGGMPSWSPDGTQIVCHTYTNPQTIDVINADGTGRETIIKHWGSPRWFPRGNRIASLTPDREILEFDLVAGREQSVIRGQRALMASGTSAGTAVITIYIAEIGFAISPDGNKIGFGENDGGLLVAALNGKGGQAPLRRYAEPLKVRHCSFSPDGKQIVFGAKSAEQQLNRVISSTATTSPQPRTRIFWREQLFVTDLDSDNDPEPLPGQDTTRNNSCPDWSPDGKTIVFVRQLKEGEKQ